jgi:hypothetical protein
LLPDNVFHPVKQQGDENLHEELREDIKDARRSNYQPINNLPDFLQKKKRYV